MIYKFNNEEFDNESDYLEALKESDNRYKSYDIWTDQDDSELIKLSKTMSVYEMANYFMRIEGAILSRLYKLLVTNEYYKIHYLDGGNKFKKYDNDFFSVFYASGIDIDWHNRHMCIFGGETTLNLKGCVEGKLVEWYDDVYSTTGDLKPPSMPDDGQPKLEINFKNSKLHGNRFEWYENGQIKSQQKYINGNKDGLWRSFYDNGQKRLEGCYKDGGRVGKFISWYRNGQKKSEGEYNNRIFIDDGFSDIPELYPDSFHHIPTGEHVKWYENGQKKLEENYKDGGRVGKFISWYRNGQKESENNYSHRDHVFKCTKWYRNGQKEAEVKCTSIANSYTIWNENGQKEVKGEFIGSEFIRSWRWSESESYFRHRIIVNTKNNKYSEWYEDGQKKLEENYKNGVKNGKFTHWHKDGSIELSKCFTDGNDDSIVF